LLQDRRQEAVFVVLNDRKRLNEVLEKIEMRYLNKLLEIMKENHFLKGLSKNALTKFIISQPANGKIKGYGSLMLSKVRATRHQLIYREGEISDKLYIVSKGDYEMSRKLSRDLKEGA
jgi:CRP-like cAMP-binding protein